MNHDVNLNRTNDNTLINLYLFELTRSIYDKLNQLSPQNVHYYKNTCCVKKGDAISQLKRYLNQLYFQNAQYYKNMRCIEKSTTIHTFMIHGIIKI